MAPAASGHDPSVFAYPFRMHMRLTMGRTKPGDWHEFESDYRQYIEGRPAPGLRARWLVRSKSEPDTFFTISLWDSLAEMEAYERSDAVRRQVLKHIAPHLQGVSTAHHCEVRGSMPVSLVELARQFEPTPGDR